MLIFYEYSNRVLFNFEWEYTFHNLREEGHWLVWLSDLKKRKKVFVVCFAFILYFRIDINVHKIFPGGSFTFIFLFYSDVVY